MLFGRSTRSTMPEVPKRKANNEAVDMRIKRQQVVKRYYDKSARHLKTLVPNQNILYQHKPGEMWHKGKVMCKSATARIDHCPVTADNIDETGYTYDQLHLTPVYTLLMK